MEINNPFVVYNLNDRFSRSFQSLFLFTAQTDRDL